jgi:glycogen(starch) synthase
MPLSFSIVVCTYNRAALLANTLDSLQRLRYPAGFEIIVVNGPSSDDTSAVIDAWRGRIRSARCALANLAMSRNIGIGLARGDIVAFIDDDALAEPEWLAQLAAAYDEPQVGAAGGIVIGHTGREPQYEYATANRLGGAAWAGRGPSPHLCFPGSFEFPYLQGTNASFRRTALLELGGFDEEFEYYLEETELCCRLIDAGYLIRQLPDAFVHHKFAPSAIRDHQRIVRHHYPIIKNKVYFSYKHGGAYQRPAQIEYDNRKFISGLRGDVENHVAAGRLPPGAMGQFDDDSARAWHAGRERARHGIARAPAWPPPRDAFLPCPPLGTAPARSVVLVSADYPPGHSGGIATYNKALAEALAARGDIVHVITRSKDSDRIDLENGVWVHRLLVREIEQTPAARARAVPQHIWNWSATAHGEACRIAVRRPLDVVEAPIWDAEGIAFLLEWRWPLVTALQTTLHFWLASHPGYRNDAHWMATFGTPMLELERQLMAGADAVRAISAAIRADIETAYGFRFDAARVVHAALGLAPAAGLAPPAQPGVPTVLFVGRLEHRKGIDVLLRAIPAVLAALPAVRFRILGDNTLTDSHGSPPSARFMAEHAGAPWLAQVCFEGRVDDEVLRSAYAGCDLFVAPSRFESFGLVLLEAMREGKAVIACLAGGMPEVVDHGVTGLLVAPGDSTALTQAMLRLLGDAALRRQMGDAGRRRYDDGYTSARMAQASDALYRTAAGGRQR